MTAPVTALRQPMPDTIETPEGALAVLRHAEPGTREWVYAQQYLDGWFAGHTWRLSGSFTTEQADRRMSAYCSRVGALSLGEALAASDPWSWEVRGPVADMGWLRGHADGLDGADDVHPCRVDDCRRALTEADGAHYCLIESAWFCASETRDCFEPICRGFGHVECHDTDGI